MYSLRQKYAPVGDSTQQYHDDSESNKALLEEAASSQNSSTGVLDNQRRSRTRTRLLIGLNLALFCVSVLVGTLSCFYVVRAGQNINNSLLKKTSYYSPMLDRIDIPLTTVPINGTLLNTQPQSIFRQDPSPEVDAAWERFAAVGSTSVSSEEVLKLGKDPTRTAKFPPDFGLGDDAHIAEIDVFHQIHCLDYLRREANYDYYFADKHLEGTALERHQTHTTHCVYLLLQNLMCNANVDIITHHWVDVQKHPFPDFNINHQCRDFEAVLKWQEENVVDPVKYQTLRRPVDEEPWIMSDEFRRMFNQGDYSFNDVDHL